MFTVGEEQTITLPDGRKFVLGLLTCDLLRKWCEWITNRLGDPFALADRYLDKAPDAFVERLLAEAKDVTEQIAYFNLAVPIAQRMLGTELGGARLFELLLQVKQPMATEDDGLAIMIHLGKQGLIAQTLAKASGTAGTKSAGVEHAEGNAVPAA